jgi:hypothetical protein
LAIALELFQIDNSELFKKYSGQEELPDILGAYWAAMKKINRTAIIDGDDSKISRGSRYMMILFEELGFI